MKNKRLLLIFLLSIILLLFFAGLNMYMSYDNIKDSVQQSIANNSIEAAESIAASIDVETYKKFLEDPVKNKEYWEIRAYLNDAREKVGALYVYTLKVDNPKVSYGMIMGMPKEDDIYTIGDPCTVPEKQVKKAYKGETYYTGILDDPHYGRYLSVGAPIKAESGEIIGYIGIDLSTDMLDEISGKVFKNNISSFIFSGVFVIVLLLSFFFLQKWYHRELKKEVVDTVDTYQDQLQSLMSTVHSIRHDFINHIQVVHGLLKIGNQTRAIEYLNDLFKETRSLEPLKLTVENPALSVLLQTKKIAVQSQNIEMDIHVSNDRFDKVKITDLIKILSNLIDNAIEATSLLTEDQRRIGIECKREANQYVMTIKNSGPKIDERNMELVFKRGFSTKQANGKTRGQGLYIVKETTSKYGGSISITSNDLETTAVVTIPILNRKE